MTRLMQDVIAELEALPPEEQDALAAETLALMEAPADWGLAPEQLAEIDRRLAQDEPPLSEEEARAFFRKLGA